jgi:hypothetical protein
MEDGSYAMAVAHKHPHGPANGGGIMEGAGAERLCSGHGQFAGVGLKRERAHNLSSPMVGISNGPSAPTARFSILGGIMPEGEEEQAQSQDSQADETPGSQCCSLVVRNRGRRKDTGCLHAERHAVLSRYPLAALLLAGARCASLLRRKTWRPQASAFVSYGRGLCERTDILEDNGDYRQRFIISFREP